MSKVSIIGAGFVGSTIAHWAMISGGCEVVLVDVVDGLAQGKVLDLIQAGPIAGHAIDAVGTTDYAETANSDLVIITAGVARKPGMTREDLVGINAKIVTDVVQQVVPRSPNAILLIMTNPLDTMTYLAYKLSGFPRARVIGQAGVLDGGRMRTFIAMETGISLENIHTTVLGGHGDEMVPSAGAIPQLPHAASISRRRLTIAARTRDGGAEIVRYLKTGPHMRRVPSLQDGLRHHQKCALRFIPFVYLQGRGNEDIRFRRAGCAGLRWRAAHPRARPERRGTHRASRPGRP